MSVWIDKQEPVWTIIIDRPEKKNAVDRDTAESLAAAFESFGRDPAARVGVLWGKGGTFCAGADLKAVAEPLHENANRLDPDMSKNAPMGPTRMRTDKPVIAAISGHAVAGGLELACWCDIRVVEETAIFGVYCRRFGVPLIDGGTQRLPRIIGMGRALDLILTGRSVDASEALQMGLANYVVPEGAARREAERLAARIADFPQICMKNDRQAVYQGFDQPLDRGMALEFELGMKVIESGETVAGARRFATRNE